MGSAQSLLSPEAAVTVAVVAGAVGFGYTQLSHGSSSPPSNTSPPEETAAKKGKKKKQSGKKAGGEASESTSSPASKPETPEVRVVPFPEVIPGQFDTVTPAESSAPEGAVSKAKKSKKKKGKAAGTEASAASPGTGANTPHASPAGASSAVDYLSEASVKPAQASKSKTAKRPVTSSQQTPQEPSASAQAPTQTPNPPTPSTSPQLTRPLHLSTTSLDTDGSWTRVGSRRRDATASSASVKSAAESTANDTGVAASNNSSPVAERAAASTTEDESQPDSFLLHSSTRDRTGENRKTLAEKLLPKPRKTGVDDMLETPDYPTLARVMRVQPLPNEKPASGFSWADYEDVRVATDGGENDADGEDDGWGVVTNKRSKRTISTSQVGYGDTSHSPHTAKAPETLTKRQRQNADKRDAQKAAKADAEAERLATLAKHKHELEKVKMAEQEKERERERKKGKAVSGGMKAGVDEKGRLVWE